jgi:purine-binding chemotaxis protein CheW
MKVQEVTGSPAVVPVPLAPDFIRGLINLRGQVATALGLRQLLGVGDQEPASNMSVVCKIDGNLISFLVDSIGDVLDISDTQFEPPPETVSSQVRAYLKGIYKMDRGQLSKELTKGENK